MQKQKLNLEVMIKEIRQYFQDLNRNKKAPIENNKYLAGGAPIFIYRNGKVGVLLLHSYTSTPYEMRELANYLADKGITVYAPVIAGHGTCPEDLAKTSIAEWQQSVEQAYQFLKEKVEKVFVIGSSFGGNLAFYLATKFTNPLGGIISIGTPIKVRWQKIFKLGLYTYGFLKKDQKKSRRDYHLTYNEVDQVVYPVMPVKSLRRFFTFIKKITIPSLPKISVPTLIIQSSQDRIVDPNSAQYLHENLTSSDKRILWINGNNHAFAIDEKRNLIFNTIYHFISENQ